MAGDTDSRLQEHEENGNTIRQPFLIGVSGGTASGKVRVLHQIILFFPSNLIPFGASDDVIVMGARDFYFQFISIITVFTDIYLYIYHFSLLVTCWVKKTNQTSLLIIGISSSLDGRSAWVFFVCLRHQCATCYIRMMSSFPNTWLKAQAAHKVGVGGVFLFYFILIK